MLKSSLACLARHKGSTVAPQTPMERFSRKWQVPGASTRPRDKDPDFKGAYVLQSFIRDKHLHDLQSIDFNGMYKEELSVERSRHPNTSKTLVIGTNGSLVEREFEFIVPPIVAVYNDRHYAHRSRVVQLAKVGKLKGRGSWTYKKAPEMPDMDTCNALEFPFCIPRKIPVRNPVADPLNNLATRLVVPAEEDPLRDE